MCALRTIPKTTQRAACEPAKGERVYDKRAGNGRLEPARMASAKVWATQARDPGARSADVRWRQKFALLDQAKDGLSTRHQHQSCGGRQA